MYPGITGQERPDEPAVVMATSGEVLTHGQLDERSNRVAHLWRAAGLCRGDHVALFMENNVRFFEVVWAALRSGLYLTAINSHLTADEVAYIADDCGARSFVSSAALGGVTGAIDWSSCPAVETRFVVDAVEAPSGFERLEDAVAGQPSTAIADESSGATMLYSSGTTGRPKGVLRALPTDQPWEADTRVAGLKKTYGYRPDMVYLSPAPLYHAAPLAFSLGTHRVGGAVVVMERFDPLHALRLIEQHGVTHSQWVPTMFVRLLRLPEEDRHRHDLSSHEVAIHAAAPCPVPVKHQMIEWWGPILHEYYAGTEGIGSTYISSQDWLAHPGSVGRPGAGSVHIIGPDGTEVPPRTEGTIYFSGGGRFEYHNAPEKTAESRLGEDLLTLGDVGYVDEEGWLYLTDRKAYMIISGGVNIYPREIEDVLISHPAVADVAVFGVPNDDLGEEVKAVVQPLDGVEVGDDLARQLIAFCRDHLAGFKVPRSVDFEAQLPRLPTGKLYKRLLRDRYWGRESTGTIV